MSDNVFYVSLSAVNVHFVIELKTEYKVLNDRVSDLQRKERDLERREANLQHLVDAEAAKVVALREQDLQLEIEKLDASLREKTRENRRLQENFNTLKAANDMLKRQVK